MRRKDREVTDFNEILKIIDECKIIRVGLADGDFPYIVPLNFAYSVSGTQLKFYVHGAMSGRKYELMKRNRKCSFEMDIPLKIALIPDKKDVTMRYKCVMGTARIAFPEGEEKQKAIDSIVNRYEESRGFDYNRKMTSVTMAAELKVLSLTAKVNPDSDEK